MTYQERFEQAEKYLQARTGKYEWRCIRYNHVYDLMVNMGLNNDDLIIDIGAGYGDMDYFLRHTCHFKGRYLPIDAALDGTDLNLWSPRVIASFIIGMEILEHLDNPYRMMDVMKENSRKGCIATTPNPAVVDVFAMDKTHKVSIPEIDFQRLGWNTYTANCFGKDNDSIIAYVNWFNESPFTPQPKAYCSLG